MSQGNTIRCTTTLLPSEDRDIFDTYDEASSLSFELSRDVHETAFVCVHIDDEAAYLYRDDLEITGTSFSLNTDQNFLDTIKTRSDSGSPTIKMSYQVELADETIHGSLDIQNPWS